MMSERRKKRKRNIGEVQSKAWSAWKLTITHYLPNNSARVEEFTADAEEAMEARLQQMAADAEANLHTQWVEGEEQVRV